MLAIIGNDVDQQESGRRHRKQRQKMKKRLKSVNFFARSSQKH